MKNKLKTAIILVLSLTMLMSLVGCNHNETLYQVEPPKESEETSEGEQEQVEEALSINQFGFEMYDKISTGENVCYSPYSIAMAFSVLANGAKGNTQQEILSTLGITDLNAWNEACSQTLNQKPQKGAEIYLANSLWLSDKASLNKNIEEEFIYPCEKYYNMETQTVDFTQAKTLDKINDWVSDHTDKMIDPFLGSISKEIKVCIINAIYFDGTWTKEFSKEDTNKNTFFADNGQQSIDMMHMYDESYRYFANEQLQAIELPYGKDESAAMDIFMTKNEDENVNDILTSMSMEEKEEVLNALASANKEEVNRLSLPKFTLETDAVDISAPLKQMGMKQAFDASTAEFSTIGNQLYVEQVMHKAKIIVDEKGTKAAAATAIMMNDACMAEDDTLNFDVNRPFFYIIRDTTDNRILFMGYMNQINQ